MPTAKKSKYIFKPEILIALIAVLFGGGSFLGVKVISADDIKEEVKKDIEPQIIENQECIEANQETIIKHDNKINIEIVPVLKSIQYIQHRQYAQQEARRITNEIKNRLKREQAYDRIREMNLKRLNTGKDVCLTLECNQ